MTTTSKIISRLLQRVTRNEPELSARDVFLNGPIRDDNSAMNPARFSTMLELAECLILGEYLVNILECSYTGKHNAGALFYRIQLWKLDDYATIRSVSQSARDAFKLDECVVDSARTARQIMLNTIHEMLIRR